MKPKPESEPEGDFSDFSVKPRRTFWGFRSIGQLMIVVALSGLVLAVVTGRQSSTSRGALKIAKIRRAGPPWTLSGRQLAFQPRGKTLSPRGFDLGMIKTAPQSVDDAMIKTAPAGIDEAMIVNPFGPPDDPAVVEPEPTPEALPENAPERPPGLTPQDQPIP
jgi:hypothetical protein